MFGSILKKLRTQQGLSQKNIAKELYVVRQTVSKWENGQAEPDIDTIYKLAELFNTTVDELVGKDKETEGEVAEEPDVIKGFFVKNKKKIIVAAVVAKVCCLAPY